MVGEVLHHTPYNLYTSWQFREGVLRQHILGYEIPQAATSDA